MAIEIGTFVMPSRRGTHTAPVIRKAIETGTNPSAAGPVDFGAVFKNQLAPAVVTATPPKVVPAQPNASPAQPTAASLPAKLAALPNGGLMANPTGNNAMSGGTIPYNPNYYATLAAALE